MQFLYGLYNRRIFVCFFWELVHLKYLRIFFVEILNFFFLFFIKIIFSGLFSLFNKSTTYCIIWHVSPELIYLVYDPKWWVQSSDSVIYTDQWIVLILNKIMQQQHDVKPDIFWHLLYHENVKPLQPWIAYVYTLLTCRQPGIICILFF